MRTNKEICDDKNSLAALEGFWRENPTALTEEEAEEDGVIAFHDENGKELEEFAFSSRGVAQLVLDNLLRKQQRTAAPDTVGEVPTLPVAAIPQLS